MTIARKSLFETCTNDPVKLHALEIKSKLAAIIRLVLSERKLKQIEVAKLLETTQPRVSDLLNGKLRMFSLDFLVDSLFRLGYTLQTGYNPANLQAPLEMVLQHGSESDASQPLYSARQVAHTLIERGGSHAMEFARVRLQKLLYAAHGQMLAQHDRPLISEPFSAWKNGPLVESLHHELKVYGKDHIRAGDDGLKGWGRVPETDTDAIAIIDDVLRTMGHATNEELVDWVRAEDGPWHPVYHDNTQRTTIENADIRRHFQNAAAIQA